MRRDDEDAADVLQETLLAAARTRPDFRGASSVSTWLYTIARSFCIKKRRSSKFAPAALESLDQQADQGAAVAEALGISVDAVKSRLHRACMAVRERVAPVPPAVERSVRAALQKVLDTRG